VVTKYFSPVWATVAAAAAGASTWWYVSTFGHRREAWDSPMYFTMAYPIVAVVAVVLAFIEPWKPWRWAMIPFAAQAVVMIVQNPSGSMMPLGLIVFAILGGFIAIPATFVAWLRQRLFST
jgi:hypothetical protein